MKKYRVGVAGSMGMVGGALQKYFEKKDFALEVYDIKGEGSIENINRSDYVYICVPTPYTDNGCDISAIEDVVSQLKPRESYIPDMEDGPDFTGKVIIIKSTVIPGTTEKLQGKYPQHKFLFNPEFLTEETADQDMCYPDRQIIGYTEKSYNVSKDVLAKLPLAPFERIVPAKEAEMAKYYNNCWFATKVIFANQIYDACQKAGINYDNVKDMAAADKRIGRTHLDVWHKGFRGYDCKCIPKDISSFISYADSLGVELELLKTTRKINDELLKHE